MHLLLFLLFICLKVSRTFALPRTRQQCPLKTKGLHLKNKLTAFALQKQCNCTLKALILQRKNNAFESGVEKTWLAKAYQTFEKGEKLATNTHAH